MPNGKPGDHPLSDILNYKTDLYSPLAATLVREIALLADEKTMRALGDLLVREFDPYGRPDVVRLERELNALRDRLRKDARDRGFEVD
jgi:hypothetical protein